MTNFKISEDEVDDPNDPSVAEERKLKSQRNLDKEETVETIDNSDKEVEETCVRKEVFEVCNSSATKGAVETHRHMNIYFVILQSCILTRLTSTIATFQGLPSLQFLTTSEARRIWVIAWYVDVFFVIPEMIIFRDFMFTLNTLILISI